MVSFQIRLGVTQPAPGIPMSIEKGGQAPRRTVIIRRSYSLLRILVFFVLFVAVDLQDTNEFSREGHKEHEGK
jgi:hypothetical protein